MRGEWEIFVSVAGTGFPSVRSAVEISIDPARQLEGSPHVHLIWQICSRLGLHSYKMAWT